VRPTASVLDCHIEGNKWLSAPIYMMKIFHLVVSSAGLCGALAKPFTLPLQVSVSETAKILPHIWHASYGATYACVFWESVSL